MTYCCKNILKSLAKKYTVNCQKQARNNSISASPYTLRRYRLVFHDIK